MKEQLLDFGIEIEYLALATLLLLLECRFVKAFSTVDEACIYICWQGIDSL